MNKLIKEQPLNGDSYIESPDFKTVLYTQGETPLEDDKIIVDGKLYSFDSSNQMLYDSQSLLLDKTGMKEIDLKSDNLKCFCKKNHKKGKGIFFQGLYKTTVKSGSRNYYMYYAETNDIDKAISQFKLLSERILSYEWLEDDLELISKGLKKKQVWAKKLWIGLVFLFVVLGLLWALKPKPETNINTNSKDSLEINNNCEINKNYDGQ